MSIDTYERYCSELSLGNIHPVIVNCMTHWMAENEQNKEIFKVNTEEKTAKNRLIQRVESELNAYENWLLELPKKEILNHTHEYSVLCDIVFLIRDEDVISETTAEKLLLSRDILSDLSKDLEKFDLNINEEICTVIEERAKKLAEKSKEPGIDLVM